MSELKYKIGDRVWVEYSKRELGPIDYVGPAIIVKIVDRDSPYPYDIKLPIEIEDDLLGMKRTWAAEDNDIKHRIESP